VRLADLHAELLEPAVWAQYLLRAAAELLGRDAVRRGREVQQRRSILGVDDEANPQQGQCQGSTVGKEIQQWIKDHRAIFIAICVVVGVLLLVGVARCAWLSFQRRRNPFRAQAMANAGYYAYNGAAGRRSGAAAPSAMSGAAWPGQRAWKDDNVSPASSSQGSYENHRQQPTLPRVDYGNSAWRYG
jgi:hypothetical protein